MIKESSMANTPEDNRYAKSHEYIHVVVRRARDVQGIEPGFGRQSAAQ